MDVGLIKIAEDKDFEKLKKLYDDNNDWRLDYNKPDLSVWTKTVPGISFRMVKVDTHNSLSIHVVIILIYLFIVSD